MHTDLARLRRGRPNKSGGRDDTVQFGRNPTPYNTPLAFHATQRTSETRAPAACQTIHAQVSRRPLVLDYQRHTPSRARPRRAGAMSAGASHHAAGRCCTVHPFAHASPHQIAIFPAAHGSLLTPHFPHAHTPIAPQRLPAGARGAARSQRPGRPTWPAPCPCSACRCRRTS